jgi:membrane protein implicated in regulation of membrane protease activity
MTSSKQRRASSALVTSLRPWQDRRDSRADEVAICMLGRRIDVPFSANQHYAATIDGQLWPVQAILHRDARGSKRTTYMKAIRIAYAASHTELM